MQIEQIRKTRFPWSDEPPSSEQHRENIYSRWKDYL